MQRHASGYDHNEQGGMSDCIWKAEGEGFVCERCGTLRPQQVHRNCSAAADAKSVLRTGPCLHQGHELRRELCPSCRGHVEVKVLACEIHKSCTLAKQIPGVACCQGCKDYSA